MDSRLTLIIFQLLVIVPFLAGIGLKRFTGIPRERAKKIISFNLIFIEPVIALWSIWGMSLELEQVVLPVAGISMVVVGFFLGMASAPATGRKGVGRITYIISSSLANHGITMGGFFCYLLLGERGIALSFIFIVYFLPFVFLFIFPYARKAGARETRSAVSIRDFFLDARNMPLLGFGAALLVKSAGFERPAIPFPFEALVMLSVALYYCTLGLTAVIKKPAGIMKDLCLLSSIKFIALPAVMWALLSFMELSGDTETVLIVQSCMPAAIYSVIASVMFDLDDELASMLFLFNTAIFIVLVAPIIIIFIK